jgi:hypothetical protein
MAVRVILSRRLIKFGVPTLVGLCVAPRAC